jgi:hypothetical protein
LKPSQAVCFAVKRRLTTVIAASSQSAWPRFGEAWKLCTYEKTIVMRSFPSFFLPNWTIYLSLSE